MKIIFLDIDGVMNCEDGYAGGYCKYVAPGGPQIRGREFRYQTFTPWSKLFLNKLIDNTNAKLVISSTWRGSGMEFMQRVWESEGMNGEIIGLTPHLHMPGYGSLPRGCEIEAWLNDKGYSDIFYSADEQRKQMAQSGIDNYVIIDDDSDMLYQQRDHFVHVHPSPRNKRGFTQKEYLKALAMLSLSAEEINCSGKDD